MDLEGNLKMSERIFLQKKRLANIADSIGLAKTEGSLAGGYLAWVEREISTVILGLGEMIEELEKDGC